MNSLSKNERNKLFSMFENLDDEDVKNKREKTRDSDVLLIDGNNTFMRAFMANPALDQNGEHIGGIDGFFKSIGYAIRLLKPTRCVIVFDGKGGSARRKALYPQYKEGRKTRMRLNRVYEDVSTPDYTLKSVLEQLQKVAVICQNLPVSMMAIENIEADDSIAYMCTDYFNKPETESIVIMSNDKDFYQLINDKVTVYSPTKKKMYGKAEVIEEFGIPPQNFIFYRILDGDKSDNINGVSGLGLKTVKKVIPIICEDTQMTLEQLLKYAEDNADGKYKAYNNINESRVLVERNYGLMQLGTADISSRATLKIVNSLQSKVHAANVSEFTLLLKKYNLFSCFKNHHVWLRETFEILNYYIDRK